MSKLPLGSLAIQAPSLQPHVVHVSPSTCHDLSLFKELMKEYRKLDDSIVVRLNRTNAQFRDRQRTGETNNLKGNVDDQTCAYMWQQLVENWKRRAEIIEYCVSVVDQPNDPSSQRTSSATMFAEDVKRNQVRNEVVVETIVRQRTLDAFRSRCKYFIPPLSDADARKWWDSAQRRS